MPKFNTGCFTNSNVGLGLTNPSKNLSMVAQILPKPQTSSSRLLTKLGYQ